MYRSIIDSLKKWKDSPYRKPLVLKGARQVGKTYILKKFAEECFENFVYINCDHNQLIKDIFKLDYDMQRVIRNLESISGQHITAGKTLIILDEIQEVEFGLASLKYFCEILPELHVAVAGSLLGISLRNTSFPVGKVDFLQMYPMSFHEFIMALGEENLIYPLQNKLWEETNPIRSKYIELLRQYFFVGGMPEAVTRYIETGNLAEVRSVQSAILEAYRYDINKHTTASQAERIYQVLQSLPAQLAKENKKFVFGAVRKGARASDFEIAIQWLIDCGLVYKVPRVTKAEMPLTFYKEMNVFKLFFLDVGLLAAMANVPSAQLLVAGNAFVEFKGAFTEEYVLSQLVSCHDFDIAYYSSNENTLEIDFIIQKGGEIIPVEVKAEENLRAKSLKTFLVKHPDLTAWRFSMSGYEHQERIINFPLYTVDFI